VERAALLLAAALLAAGLPGASPAPEPCAAGVLCGEPLDLNRAEPETLEVLPGIGPARARAIAEARPFRSVDELERVRGIGNRTLEGLRDLVEVRP
jgi:competence protein ComEA